MYKTLIRALALVLAAGLTFAAAPAAAAPDPAPGFRLVPGDTALSDAQRIELKDNRVPYSRAGQRAGRVDDTDLRTACSSHRAEAQIEPRGWLRDRFQQCFAKRKNFIVIRDDNGAPAGEVTFELWLLGWGNHGVRQVDYSLSVEDITVSTLPGNVIDWPNQLIHFMVSGCTPSADVTCGGDVARTVDQWYRTPVYAFTTTSAPGTGTGLDFVRTQNLIFDVRVGTLPVRPGGEANVVQSNARYDSGRKMDRAHGAVFPDFRNELVLSLSDPEVNESALHIRDAQDNPTRTFPSWVGKSVPGKPGGEPLHRSVDDIRRENNRSAAIRTCVEVWGPEYATGGVQCDEYPFAVTYEGAANSINGTPTRRYSARPIDGGDNGAGGARLSRMYGANRVIDGEAFHVRITA